MMRKILHQILPELLQNYYGRKFPDFNIDISNDKNWDLVLNIALQNAKLFNQAPLTMANEIKTLIQNNSELSEYFTQVEIKAPGFILLKINSDRLVDWLVNTPTNWGNGEFYQGKKILIEFAQPNTHKPLHIGHLRNICLGESLARILESQNGQVFRANYQGDIGPHVAKCLWALQKYPEDMPSEPRQRALLLGKKYAEGTKLSDGRKATETVEAIPANPQNQAEVQVINRAIYDH
nr:arginine--tRNA ligase [Candidatus Gracilibacteria bacterium]